MSVTSNELSHVCHSAGSQAKRTHWKRCLSAMRGFKMITAALCVAVLLSASSHSSALKMEDLTPEQQQEARNQQSMLSSMLQRLEGLDEEGTKRQIQEFTPQERELLKAYYEHQQQRAQDTAESNRRLTPERQQEMLKEMFEQLEDKSYGEQQAIIKKFTPQQKDLFDRYNAYQKKQQEEYAEQRKKELGQCEAEEVYTQTTPTGDLDFTKPQIEKCARVRIWDEEIGDDGVSALVDAIVSTKADDFIALILDTTDISALGAATLGRLLHKCPNIRALDLDSNSIGDDGAAALATAAATHPHLETLGLAHNDISDAGGDALLSLLRNNYQIVTLPLHGNRISKNTLNAIEELLQKNRALAVEKAEKEQAAANQTRTAGDYDDVIDGGDADGHEEL
eukprot:m.1142438 g.1142438  ORF g.1142438 m.1142438 type:complete len:395 (+) comp24455_c0_seq4:224-1408(+)